MLAGYGIPGTAIVEQTLDEAGLQYKRVEADHYGVRPCPFCGHDGFKLTIHVETGQWDCKVCNEKGNIPTLRKAMNLPMKKTDASPMLGSIARFDRALGSVTKAKNWKTIERERVAQAEAALWSDESALAYLRGRGLTDDTIRAFHLGLKELGSTKYLAIPHFEGETVVNVKQRSLPPAEKSFIRVKGCRSILFNVNAITEETTRVYLCEGEIDTMSLVQLGFPNAVGTTTGAASSFPAEWLEALDPVAEVYIVYDADGPGQKGAFEKARQLGLSKVWNVRLPDGVKDVNEFLQNGGTKETFQALIDTAEQFDVNEVEHIGKALDRLREEIVFGQDEDESSRVSLVFDGMKRIAGSPKPGERVDIMATPKTGKTSYVLQIADENAIQGRGVLVICLEMSNDALARRVVQSRYCVAETEITLDILDNAKETFGNVPLYLTYLPGCTVRNLPDVLALIRDAVRRYNLRLVIFDNLQLLIRGSAQAEQDTALVSKEFLEIAKREKFTLALVVQPKRTERGKPVRPGDGKGSGAIEADADLTICLHRDEIKDGQFDEEGVSEGAMEPLTQVWAQGRNARGGTLYLWFEEQQSRFRKLTPGEVDAYVKGKK